MGIPERKKREAEERRQRILAASVELFRETEWDALTVEQIAQHAEIGKGTVYKHFASKDELLAAMILAHDEGLSSELEALGQSADVVADIIRSLRLAWEYDLRDPLLSIKAAHYVSRTSFVTRIGSATRDRLDVIQRRVYAYFAGLVERGIREGVLSDHDVQEMLFLGQAAIRGAHQAALLAFARGQLSVDELNSRFESRFVYLSKAILRAWGCADERLATYRVV